MEPVDITIEKWREANNQLETIGRIQASHTVVLVNESSHPFGTCVLLQYGKKKYFLTAAHVAQEIGKIGYKKIAVAVVPDEVPRILQLHPSEAFKPKPWDPNFKVSDLLEDPYQVKDLAIIEIPLFLESIINATKEFARLPEETIEELDLNASYVGFGVVDNSGKKQMTSFAFCLSEKQERDGRDYYIARSMKKTFGSIVLEEPNILDFQGYSGGGLFLFKDKSIRLVGLAYYQDPDSLMLDDGYVAVHFYGPKSLRAFLKDCG